VLGHSFLFCRRCSEAHRVSEFDRAPIYRLNGTEVVEEPADDRRQFIELHGSHGIAEIFAIANARMRGPTTNPMAIRDVEVSDGKAGFVLRGLRKTIQEPITYRLLPKQLSLWEER
jgi:hypothetical protein